MRHAKTAFAQDIFREIRKTFNRFMAIFAIVALGVGFFVGLKATTPDMETTGNLFYDEQNFMDFRLLSTMGFTEDDAEALRSEPYIKGVSAGYTADVLLESPTGNRATRVMSLPDDLSDSNPDFINRPILEAGRYPEAPGECMIDVSAAEGSAGLSAFGTIGDTLVLSPENSGDTLDLLRHREYEVVGTFRTPLYISFQRASTDIGSGIISHYMLVSSEEFDSDYYLEMYATVKGAEELNTFSSAYEDFSDDMQERLETFADGRAQIRYDDIVSEAQQKIDDGEREVSDAEQEAADAESAWSDGQAEYEQQRADAERQLQEARDEISSGESEVAASRRRLNRAQAQIEDGEAEYAQSRAEFRTQIAQAESELAQREAELEAAEAQYEQGSAQLSAGEAQAAALEEQIAQMEEAGLPDEQIEPLRAQLQAAQTQLEASRSELEAAASQIEQGRAQLSAGRSELETERRSGQAQLDAARRRLDQSIAELESGRQQLSQAERQLENGRAELNEQSEQADRELTEGQQELDNSRVEIDDAWAEIANARTELEDARSELADVEKPEWYVLSRDMNLGYASFKSDSQKVGNLADIFPVFFFMVAALVCLTTMTRMVEEQRTQIGVMKALGYGGVAIASKYLIYAALATVLGCITGIVVGSWVFPETIWYAYGIMYTMRPLVVEFYWPAVIIGGGAATAVTVLAALWAVYAELAEVPANLIRPKAPAPGKRVLLERLPALWSRLNFSQKVTARNLFRYKKRFFMTILGIMGCTALMVTGFGLRDSITGIVSMQYGKVMLYDMQLTLEEPYTPADKEALAATLDADIPQWLPYADASGTGTAGGKSLDCEIIVAAEPDRLPEFVSLQERESGRTLPLPADGEVVVSEKFAEKLGLHVGDSVDLTRGETNRAAAVVSGITENYVYNNLYMSPETYTELFGEEPSYDHVWGRLDREQPLTAKEEEELSSELLRSDLIDSMTFTSKTSRDFGEILRSLDAVVWLLIGCANLLAFIVLYNLVNINITERTREIATLKVLGFFDPEVSRYVFRENLILSAIGAFAGLFMGAALHQYVVQAAEVDIVMFGRTVHLLSYVYSFALTMVFSLLVEWFMHFKLRSIDMVESLKSAE